MRETALVVVFIATTGPRFLRLPMQEEPWIVVAPIGQPDETPQEVELAELQKRPGAYRDHLILVTGKLGGIDFSTGIQPSRGISTIREASHVVPLVLLVPPLQMGLDLELESMVQHEVELVGRFADLTSELRRTNEREGAATQIHGIVVDRIRRLTKPAPETVPPSPDAENPRDLDEPSMRPPRVLSSFPNTGARGIAPDSVFRVRFSADMDPTTFADNVRLSYSDDVSHPLAIELEYGEEWMSLAIKPASGLAPLREIHLTLHAGIKSREGSPLAPADSSPTRSRFQSRRSSPGQPEASMVTLVFFTRGY